MTVKIILESLQEPVLFIPPGTVGVRIPMRGTVRRTQRRNVTIGHGFDLRYQTSDDMGLVYSATMSRFQ